MWAELDDEWRLALRELQEEEWHSTDYFRTEGRAVARKTPAPLLNVIGRHILQEFNCVSFAVEKAAAERARCLYPSIIPPSPKMLMDLCFRGIGAAKEDLHQPRRIRILFDRGEPFVRHLKTAWQNGRAELGRARADGWPRQVREVETARAKDHPGLQVADLLSWSIRCRYEYGDKMVDPKIPVIMFPFIPVLRGGFLDSDAIRALYVDRSAPTLTHGYAFR